jgi:hypothetical protein
MSYPQERYLIRLDSVFRKRNTRGQDKPEHAFANDGVVEIAAK